VNRKLFKSDLWLEKPFSKGQAWIDLIGMAEYHDIKKDMRGVEYTVRRGEVCIAKQKLAVRWGWYKVKVMRFLDCLTYQEMISQRSDENATIIRILNYERYQGEELVTVNKPEITQLPKAERVVLDKPAEEVSLQLCSFFGISELRNINQYMKVGNFCFMLNKIGRLREFAEQFSAFKKYKEKSKDKIPSLDSFLGSARESFNDGKWCAENWQNKLTYINDNSKPKTSAADRYFVSSQNHRTADRL